MSGQKMWRRLLPVLLAMLAIAGCKTQIETRVNRHPSRKMDGRTSYIWMEYKPSGDARENAENVAPLIRKMVDADFQKRGYTSAGEAKPDFRIRYLVVLYEETQEIERRPEFSGVGSEDNLGEWYEPLEQTGTRSIDQASLILECVEPDSKKFIWRGTAWAAVSLKASQREQEQQVRTAITKLLKDFP